MSQASFWPEPSRELRFEAPGGRHLSRGVSTSTNRIVCYLEWCTERSSTYLLGSMIPTCLVGVLGPVEGA